MPSGEGLRVLTAAVYRERPPGVSCLAACTTFAKTPEQRQTSRTNLPNEPRHTNRLGDNQPTSASIRPSMGTPEGYNY